MGRRGRRTLHFQERFNRGAQVSDILDGSPHPAPSDQPSLTSDNPFLSEPSKDGFAGSRLAINCTIVPEPVLQLVRASLAANTRRAYQADVRAFEEWGGLIPADPTTIASYLAAQAGILSPATLGRRLVGISKAHETRGLPNPTKTEIVRATMRGLRRQHGTAQRQARPRIRDDLILTLSRMGDGLKDVRDRAMLLIGFAGAFRRSELVGLDCADVERVTEGLVVHLRNSKTDQEAAGRKVAIPLGKTKWCPVAALDRWLGISGITEGPIFRAVDRQGNVAHRRLSGDAVSVIVKERVAAAGYDHILYSGHSLRAGLATSAAIARVPTWKIRAQTGHRSDAMLARYIRDGELFIDNAAGALL
jgi:integrase